MHTHLQRTISLTVAILLALLVAPEFGIARDASANLQNPRAETPPASTRPAAEHSNRVIARHPTPALSAGEEPFGSSGLQIADGPLALIWQSIKVGVLADMARLALCRTQELTCSKAAHALRTIVEEARSRDGLARVGYINRAINLAIKPAIDPYVWQSALETLSAGSGDCKDYAVAKYLALREVGFTEDDVKLVIVRDILARQDHAIITIRLNGDWLVLDNRWLALVHDFELRRAKPLYILDAYGVRRFGQQQARLNPVARPETSSNAQ